MRTHISITMKSSVDNCWRHTVQMSYAPTHAQNVQPSRSTAAVKRLFSKVNVCLNKYAPGWSNLTENHYNKYLNLCSLYNKLNNFSYNKVYPKLYEPSSKAIIDCLTLQKICTCVNQSLRSFWKIKSIFFPPQHSLVAGVTKAHRERALCHAFLQSQRCPK